VYAPEAEMPNMPTSDTRAQMRDLELLRLALEALLAAGAEGALRREQLVAGVAGEDARIGSGTVRTGGAPGSPGAK